MAMSNDLESLINVTQVPYIDTSCSMCDCQHLLLIAATLATLDHTSSELSISSLVELLLDSISVELLPTGKTETVKVKEYGNRDS